MMTINTGQGVDGVHRCKSEYRFAVKGFVDVMPLLFESAREEKQWRLDLSLVAGDILEWNAKEASLIGKNVVRIGVMCDALENRPFMYRGSPSSNVELIQLIMVDDVGNGPRFDTRTLAQRVDEDIAGSEAEGGRFEDIQLMSCDDALVGAVTVKHRFAHK